MHQFNETAKLALQMQLQFDLNKKTDMASAANPSTSSRLSMMAEISSNQISQKKKPQSLDPSYNPYQVPRPMPHARHSP